jgi:hypothetical protein
VWVDKGRNSNRFSSNGTAFEVDGYRHALHPSYWYQLLSGFRGMG